MIKKIDGFSKNIIIVFLGTSLLSFFNLIFQLLIAHRLDPADFAAFNSLLSFFMMIAAPLGTIQQAVAKYTAEFNARNETEKIKVLLSILLKNAILFASLGLVIFFFISSFVMNKLKVTSSGTGYMLAILLSLSCVVPVLLGGAQGLELFNLLALVSILSGAAKLILAYCLITLGFNVSGAFAAALISMALTLILFYVPIRKFLVFNIVNESIHFREIMLYLVPVALSTFCYMTLVNSDMLSVKYFFNDQTSGIYSLAQMVGKIFLFLPGAISIVMFPRTSSLHAKNQDTTATLKRSLLYAAVLCGIACAVYNLFPGFVLKILTGKTSSDSIFLGRLFSVSMTFFAFLFILIQYFLSKKDLRFFKYLIAFTLLQCVAITVFHRSLVQVQLILCINAILLFCVHAGLSRKKIPLSALRT